MADTIARDGHIHIRTMEETEQDFQTFLKWMTDTRTMKYWEGMTEHFTYERVVRDYRESREEHVEQCIIEWDSKAIGYCQFCIVNAGNYEVPEAQSGQFADKQDVVYGIDIFLGEADYRDRGIGTKCMKVLMKALFDERNADMLLIDPKTHNARAIRCYHKCGFRDLCVVPEREQQDGIYHDSLIMGIRKKEFTVELNQRDRAKSYQEQIK